MVQGRETVSFGKWLVRVGSTQGNNFRFFYDHGNAVDEHVAEIKAFYSPELPPQVSNENRVSDVDLLVATSDGRVRLLIEIEERPVSPKRLLGDVAAALLCNHVAVRRRLVVPQAQRHDYFRIERDSLLIVAGWVPDDGYRLAKIRDVIQPRIHALQGLPDGMSPSNVRLLFTETWLTTRGLLEPLVREILGIPVKT